MRELEAGASKAEARREDTRTTISEAVDLYLQKGLDEGNKSDTYEKKVRIFKGLSSEDPIRPKSHAKKIEERKKANGKYSPSLLHWAEKRGYKYITDIGLKQLMAWRSTWVGAAITRAKRQEKVCGFFHLCKNLGWITVSPAASLGPIKVEQTATGYFPADEYAHLFEVIDSWPGGSGLRETASG